VVTNPVVLEHWARAIDLGASVAITTRYGGVSTGPYESLNLGLHVDDDPTRVVTNRQRAAEAFGVPLESMVFAQQVHGATATVVGPEHLGRGTHTHADAVANSDILVTTSAAPTLVMLVADCVPLILIDPNAKVMAAVHAGWRGTAANAVGSALTTMATLGGRAERTVAFLGPAVAPERYQVGPEVHRGLAAAVAPTPLGPHVARPDGIDHWQVDLIAANRQQLELAGLAGQRILASGTTTADGDHYSDRAARPCGRFALMARLLP
jgi:YfiH family protein